MVDIRKKLGVKIDNQIWGDMFIKSSNDHYKVLLSKRNKFVITTLCMELSIFDAWVFKRLHGWGWDKMIANYFKKKVSIIEKPHAFCVRVYNKDFDNKDLTMESYAEMNISNQIKFN